MVRAPIRFLLDERDNGRVIRFVSDEVTLSEGAVRRTWVTLTRTGSFTDPRYGRFEITPKMLTDMVRNFDAGTYGQEIFLDVAHEPDKGAAAKVLQIKADGNRLRAEVEWTPYGLSAVRERGFRYLSADFYDDYIDNEAGKSHGPLLRGAGLTIRPVIKRLDPVQLAESAHPSGPVLLSPGIVRQLTERLETNMNKWLEELKRRLGQKKLSEAATKALTDTYSAAAKNLGEDDAAHEALVKQLDETATAIAAAPPGSPITLSITAPTDAKMLTEAVAKALAERDTAAKTLADSGVAKLKIYDDALAAAKGLSEETLKLLAAARDLITPELSDDQVKRLAESQIAQGNALEAARQLSASGFPAPNGSPRITIDESNGIKKLSEIIRGHFRGTEPHSKGQLRAVADESKLPKWQQKMLSAFDAQHAPALHQEAKQLAGGPVVISDTALPASFQREVLLEAVADLRIFELVDADYDPTDSATHTIPYETRVTSAVVRDGIVYEGGAIPLGGVSQGNDFAYIEPMKIGLNLSEEVMHFSRTNGAINWDAWARTIASNSQLAREITARRLMNEMQRSADYFGATAVAAENVAAQVTVGNSLIKLANFPLVRPYQARDLQGTAIGAAEHPLVVTRNGVVITEYDGSNTQAAGTYYKVESYNLGFIRYVSELGAPVMAAAAGANTIGYSYATNVVKLDLDVPGGSYLERHLNKLLQSFGAQKALLSQDRYVKPNFALMSETLNDTASNAENFTLSLRRDGADTSADGDLAKIKGVSCWGTNTLADLGEERILIGQRGNLKYRVAKPFTIGERYPILNAQGLATGKWGAHGIEFRSVKCPIPLRNRFTSVIAYSATARAAAV